MGQIKKVGDLYFIEFYARGLLYSKIGGTDLAAAEKLLAETEAAIAGGEALTVSREVDVRVFFEEFMDIAEKEFGSRSAARFKNTIKHFSAFLQSLAPVPNYLSKLTPSVFEAYKASIVSAQRPAVVNFTVLLLREMMEYGIRSGYINDNPTLHVRLLALPVRTYTKTARYQTAQDLLTRGVPLGKVYKLLGLSDIARICYFANLIPQSRYDMYN